MDLDFIKLVKEMLKNQRQFEKTQSWEYWEKSKILENEVDKYINTALKQSRQSPQGNLFQGTNK